MAFNEIPNQHLPIWVKTLRESGISDPADMLQELTLIDDLLTLQRTNMLLNRRRKKKLGEMLMDRIELELSAERMTQ